MMWFQIKPYTLQIITDWLCNYELLVVLNTLQKYTPEAITTEPQESY